MNKTKYQELLALATGEAFEVLGSGLDNACDTWREERREDAFSEEYYTFALDSVRSLLCDSASDACGAWFRANGVQF